MTYADVYQLVVYDAETGREIQRSTTVANHYFVTGDLLPDLGREVVGVRDGSTAQVWSVDTKPISGTESR